MSAIDKILFSKIESPIEIAIYQLWRISNKPTDESDTMFVVAQNAAQELAALRSELEAVKAERDEFERLAQLAITELKAYHDGWNEELGTNCIGSDICTTVKLIKELAAALNGGKG